MTRCPTPHLNVEQSTTVRAIAQRVRSRGNGGRVAFVELLKCSASVTGTLTQTFDYLRCLGHPALSIQMSKFDAAGNEVDVFSDAPAVVDCDVLEAAKENIQPLASGRRVTALSAILKTPHVHREAKLADARRRHRMNVQISMEDEDGDPLEAYCRFVYWTLENYPQGPSADSCLLELLEEATRVLKDDRDGVWRSELKYLKLWVLYASYVEKPSMIFKFLLANEVGTGHALVYEEYAGVLERMAK
jgi:hypothetical protein